MSAAAVAAGAMAVESANTVGFVNEEFNGEYGIKSVKFVPVGGYTDDFNLNDVLDTSTVMDFADELQIYDSATGDFVTYMWDTANWIDAATDEPLEVSVVPGASFLCIGDVWRQAGEVPSEDTIDIAVTSGEYCVVGGALPIAATLANFNWAPIADFADELQVYDSATGDFITYMWDTANWIDAATDEPLDFDTEVTGFIFLTDLDSITESVTPYDYGA